MSDGRDGAEVALPPRFAVVELFLAGRLDARTVVRRLVADGMDATEARLLVHALAPRVVGPLPRWGAAPEAAG